MKKALLSLSAGLLVISGMAQVRYLDDIFARNMIVKTDNVVFGQNFYFLQHDGAPSGTTPANPQVGDLRMDMYTPPLSDTENSRAVVILVHGGVFLPRYINSSVTGDKSDSAMQEIATRWAMKGYVVVVPNYRLGWNPQLPTLELRTSSILNAVYRSIHDAQTAVRFLKMESATYGVNPNLIYLAGAGSGAYTSVNYNFLDKQVETTLPKFLDGQGNSVINPSLVGFVDGTGGSLNVFNHSGYSNDICMSINFGGCLGDISWIESGNATQVPTAAAHCRNDPFAPYDSGTVIVPTTANPVVDVHGPETFIRKCVAIGLNDVWVNHTFSDPFSARAYALNAKAQNEGLFEFRTATPEEAPWQWWDPATAIAEANAMGQNGNQANSNSLQTNPNMSKSKAMAYIDTLIGFFTPRMYQLIAEGVGVEQYDQTIPCAVYPNPAVDFVRIDVDEANVIDLIEIFNLSGKKVTTMNGIGSYQVMFGRNGIPAGVYNLQLHTKKGLISRKLILH